MPTNPNPSYPATNHTPAETSIPRACLRKVGAQSKRPYRTEYTKKFAIASSQMCGFENTRRCSVLSTGSVSCFKSTVPAIGGRPSDSGVSRNASTSQAAATSANPAGTKKHVRQPNVTSQPHKIATAAVPIVCDVFQIPIFVANSRGENQCVISRAHGGYP